MGTAKNIFKKRRIKSRIKKAGRISSAGHTTVCSSSVCFTAAIIGGYVFFNIVSFAHGEIAINLDDYKANQKPDLVRLCL